MHQPLPQSLAARPGEVHHSKARTLPPRALTSATRGPLPALQKRPAGSAGTCGPCPVADPGGAVTAPASRPPQGGAVAGEPAQSRAHDAPLPWSLRHPVGPPRPGVLPLRLSCAERLSLLPGRPLPREKATLFAEALATPFAVPGMKATDATLAAELLT